MNSRDFTSSWPHRVVGRCRKCMKLDNDARLRYDFSQYRAMLKELRRSEEIFEGGSKIACLLQAGFHADSIIFAMETSHILPLRRLFHFILFITVSLTFYPGKTISLQQEYVG